MRKSWRPVLGLSIVALAIGALSLAPVASAADAGAMQGTFLFKILRFVDWPGSAFSSDADPLVVCVISAEAASESLRLASAGKRIRGRRLEVRAIGDHTGADGCHVVFSGASKAELRALVASLSGRAILSVSGERRFAEWGGAISLALVRGKIDFAVNRRSLDEADIRISAKLLRLARLIE